MSRYKHRVRILHACGHSEMWKLTRKADDANYQERLCRACYAKAFRGGEGVVFGPYVGWRRQKKLDATLLATYPEISPQEVVYLLSIWGGNPHARRGLLALFWRNPTRELLILSSMELANFLLAYQELAKARPRKKKGA